MTTDRVARPHWSMPWVLAGVGAVSGALSMVLVFFLGAHGMGDPGAAFMLPAAPGVVFGLSIGYTIGNRHYAGAGFDLGFAAVSLVASFAAIFLGMLMTMAEGGGSSYYRSLARYYDKYWHVGAVCGLLGSALLTAYAFKFLSYPPGRFGAALMILTGTVLGVALTPLAVGIPIIGLAYLLVGWQCGFAASLGFALRLRPSSGPSPPPLAVPPSPP